MDKGADMVKITPFFPWLEGLDALRALKSESESELTNFPQQQQQQQAYTRMHARSFSRTKNQS